MPQNAPQQNDEQKALRAQLDHMVQAFNEFHQTVVELKKQQQDVVAHIHTQVDQKKIEQIQNLLKQI
jgi:flagellar hook-associated protein FlgK